MNGARDLSAVARLTLAVLFLLTATACGGSDSGTPSSPTPTPAPTPTPTPSPTPTPPPTPPSSATITITSSGVSPRAVTVAAGGRVTFVNNDSLPHDMQSDPHPDHTDCPAINDVGFLQPGQRRSSGNLNTVRTCGFHDHNRDSDTSLQGTITIQ